MKLIKDIDIYSPKYLGKKDVLIEGEKIIKIDENININNNFDFNEIYKGENDYLFPGFIDNHVHICGGGGEGGFGTRIPPIKAKSLINAGITTVVGVLGTDGYTRNILNLIAKANQIENNGVNTYILTGSYGIHVKTFTDSVEKDIIYIDKIIGTGEIAISDHRSSQPNNHELLKIIAESKRGGLLSNKSGVVNIHVGSGKSGLKQLREIINETEISYKDILPTHINRNKCLFNEGIDYAKKGGYIDFTASSFSSFTEKNENHPYKALKIALDRGVNINNITYSSDGQGSLPKFDKEGKFLKTDIADVKLLYEAIKNAILKDEIDISVAIKTITENPANILGLKNKGSIETGKDADLVIVDKKDLSLKKVMCNGRFFN